MSSIASPNGKKECGDLLTIYEAKQDEIAGGVYQRSFSPIQQRHPPSMPYSERTERSERAESVMSEVSFTSDTCSDASPLNIEKSAVKDIRRHFDDFMDDDTSEKVDNSKARQEQQKKLLRLQAQMMSVREEREREEREGSEQSPGTIKPGE
jgi:hypothetical protein